LLRKQSRKRCRALLRQGAICFAERAQRPVRLGLRKSTLEERNRYGLGVRCWGPSSSRLMPTYRIGRPPARYAESIPFQTDSVLHLFLWPERSC
jgi:hypothetical protein